MSDIGTIDGYVNTLDRALPRGCRGCRTMLIELRDGLHDATAAYVEAGLPADEAERRAVSECGDVREIAEQFRTELAASQGKRAAMLLAVTMLAGIVAWDVVWNFAPPGPVGPVVLTMSGVVDWAGLAGGSSALVVIALLALGARRGTSVRPLLGGLVVATGLAVAVICGGSLAMNISEADRSMTVIASSPAVIVVSTLSLISMVAQIWALWRTLRVTFGGSRLTTDELAPV